MIGIFQHERVFQLPFLVYRRELAEFFVGVVALAVIQLGLEVLSQRDFHAAEVTVLRGVGGVVANR